MTIAEAEKAFREMLPVETVKPDINTYEIHKFDRPFEIIYQRDDSLLTKVLVAVKTSERAISIYPIEQLKLAKN